MFWLTRCCTHPYPPASDSLSIREGRDCWGLDPSPKLSWTLEMMVNLGSLMGAPCARLSPVASTSHTQPQEANPAGQPG